MRGRGIGLRGYEGGRLDEVVRRMVMMMRMVGGGRVWFGKQLWQVDGGAIHHVEVEVQEWRRRSDS